MNAEAWNRCDVCGKFIALDEFEAGTATHRLLEPDSDLGVEKWETFHEMCNPEQHDEACVCDQCIDPKVSGGHRPMKKRKPKSQACLAYEAARRAETCPVCRKKGYPPWRTLSPTTKAAWQW